MSAFRDRVALITGAGSGIGRQLARMLAGEGARIAALDLVPTGLEQLRAELTNQASPPRVATAAADVTDLPSLREAVARLEAALGPTYFLIACAGIGRSTPAERFDADEINAVLRVNLLGVVNTIDTVLAGMRQRRQGHLVALSSLASYRGLPFLSAYCASKAGVNALLDALRVELRSEGIAVTTVCPGWVRTPMTDPLGLPAEALTPVEVAGKVILEAIRRRQPFLAFPPRLVWQVRLLRYLPRSLADWLAAREMERGKKILESQEKVPGTW